MNGIWYKANEFYKGKNHEVFVCLIVRIALHFTIKLEQIAYFESTPRILNHWIWMFLKAKWTKGLSSLWTAMGMLWNFQEVRASGISLNLCDVPFKNLSMLIFLLSLLILSFASCNFSLPLSLSSCVKTVDQLIIDWNIWNCEQK